MHPEICVVNNKYCVTKASTVIPKHFHLLQCIITMLFIKINQGVVSYPNRTVSHVCIIYTHLGRGNWVSHFGEVAASICISIHYVPEIRLSAAWKACADWIINKRLLLCWFFAHNASVRWENYVHVDRSWFPAVAFDSNCCCTCALGHFCCVSHSPEILFVWAARGHQWDLSLAQPIFIKNFVQLL